MSTPYDNPAPGSEPPSPEAPVQIELPPPAEDPPWTFLGVVFLTVAALFLIFFFLLISVSIAHHRYPLTPIKDFTRNARVVLPPQILAYLVLLACMAGLLRFHGLQFWRNIRWNWPSSRWLGFLGLGMVLAILVSQASRLLPIPKQLPIEQFFADTASAYLIATFGMTLAPLIEELYFRGFLYPVLARNIGVPFGIAITALAFAFVHASQLAQAWAPLLMLFLVGLVLTVVRVRSGSVAASFLIHVGYNSTLFVVMFFLTDHFRHLEKMK